MNIVAKQIITAAGGAQSIPLKDKLASRYDVSLRSVGASFSAGTTAISATPTYGTSETVTDANGAALNVNPQALASFTIYRPISEITFTPSSWTASGALEVTVIADSPISV